MESGEPKGVPATPRAGLRGRHKFAALGVGLAVIAVVFAYLLPKLASYGQVWEVTSRMSLAWVAVLALFSTLNVLSNAPPWMAVLPRLGFLNALRVSLGASALSILTPGGAAVGLAAQFGMLRSWGFGRRSIALATALTTIWAQLIAFGFPVLAVAALATEGGHEAALIPVAFVCIVVFVAIVAGFLIGLSSRERAERIGDRAARIANRLKALVRRGPVDWAGKEFVQLRAETIGLLGRRWHVLTLAALGSQLAVFVVLVLTLRAVGATASEVSVVEAFAAWTLIRALGKIPITPGGFGVEEIALAGALIGFGATNGQAVSATLIYRFLTVAPTLLVGLVAAATFRLGQERATNA